jgi:hypothetical protein
MCAGRRVHPRADEVIWIRVCVVVRADPPAEASEWWCVGIASPCPRT